jgi:hypothetical protein
MMKIRVEKLYVNDKDFNGNPYISKLDGKPENKYTIVSADRKFKVWGTRKQLELLKENEVIEGETEEKEYEGHKYWVLKLPKPSSPEIEEIKKDIQAIKEYIGYEDVKVKEKELEEEINVDDIPF